MMAVTFGSGIGCREPASYRYQPAPVFLAESAGFAQVVRHVGEVPARKLGGPPLAQRPPDIEAGEIAHAKRTHRHAELLKCRIDLLRQGARHDEIMSGRAVSSQHAVADEAVADARHHRDLAHGFGQAHGGCQHILRRLGAAHHFEQTHHIGRTEKMQSDHILRTPREVRYLIEIQRRGVGGENRALPYDPVQCLEDLALDVHAFEHGLDN